MNICVAAYIARHGHRAQQDPDVRRGVLLHIANLDPQPHAQGCDQPCSCTPLSFSLSSATLLSLAVAKVTTEGEEQGLGEALPTETLRTVRVRASSLALEPHIQERCPRSCCGRALTPGKPAFDVLKRRHLICFVASQFTSAQRARAEANRLAAKGIPRTSWD